MDKMIIPLPNGCQIVCKSGLEPNTSSTRVRHRVHWDTSVREPSKSFQIKYFPNILSVFDALRSGDCREGLTYLAAVVTTAGKFISGLSKTFVLSGLPRRECILRSFFFFLLPFISFPFLSMLPPSLRSPLLPLSDIYPGFCVCVCVCFVHVCVSVCETFLNTVQELRAVTHFLPEA